MHTGIFDASGAPLNCNGFGAGVMLTPTDAKFDARALRYSLYMSNLTRLLDIAMSVFEWEGLPEGVDERMLEFWLLTRGCVAFFYDEGFIGSTDAPEGYAVLPAMVQGGFDLYGYPRNRTAYSINGYNRELDETNSVLVYNSDLRYPMYPTIALYAWRITNAEIALDMNIKNQKVSRVVMTDDKKKLSMKNIMDEYDDNVQNIFTTKNFNPADILQLDLSAPFVAQDVMDVRNQLWNQALTFVGVENVNTDKKERLVAGEVYGGMGAVEAQRFTRLNSRQWAADAINRTFGLDVSVEFKSGVYIRTDKEGTVPTTGMDSGTGMYDVDTETDRIMAQIRAGR